MAKNEHENLGHLTIPNGDAIHFSVHEGLFQVNCIPILNGFDYRAINVSLVHYPKEIGSQYWK